MKYYGERTGAFFSHCRNRLNLTQGEVGEFLPATCSTVSEYERGARDPSLQTFTELCNLYGVKPDEVLHHTETGDSGTLNSQEEEMLSLYRECPLRIRREIREFMRKCAALNRISERH